MVVEVVSDALDLLKESNDVLIGFERVAVVNCFQFCSNDVGALTPDQCAGFFHVLLQRITTLDMSINFFFPDANLCSARVFGWVDRHWNVTNGEIFDGRLNVGPKFECLSDMLTHLLDGVVEFVSLFHADATENVTFQLSAMTFELCQLVRSLFGLLVALAMPVVASLSSTIVVVGGLIALLLIGLCPLGFVYDHWLFVDQ